MDRMSFPASDSWPVLQTERLLLRAPRPDDLEALYAIQSDPISQRFSVAAMPESREAVVQQLDDWLAHWQAHEFGYWAIALREQPGDLLGFGGLMQRTLAGRPGLALYFRFRPQAWGQGYAAEMTQAALALAFEQQQAPAVQAVVQPANMPSRKTLERAGLRLKGSLANVPGQPADLLYEIAAAHYAEMPRLPPEATPFGA